MKDKEKIINKVVRITDTESNNPEKEKGTFSEKREKWKKPAIFLLMGFVFIGCIYMIFKPAESESENLDTGLNGAVPQASENGLESDKQKAYEKQMLEQKQQEKRNALMSLSDYWNEQVTENSAMDSTAQLPDNDDFGTPTNPSVNSYRHAQRTLTSFYDNRDDETYELRKQVEDLKNQLAQKDIPPVATVEDQLALMEKSYQMAAKYLPKDSTKPDTANAAKGENVEKQHYTDVTPLNTTVVSALYREPTDSEFITDWNETRNRGFYTAGSSAQVIRPKNSIKAVVQQTQAVIQDGSVQLRLLETAKIAGQFLPMGTVLTAKAKLGDGRLQLKVSSIEFEGTITAVDMSVFDLDGQQGLSVPNSPEMNALTQIASNMTQTGGTSIMMTRSAGQQITGDLSRGLMQGVSGYLSKKVNTFKVTLKAGHQVFLLSKK